MKNLMLIFALAGPVLAAAQTPSYLACTGAGASRVCSTTSSLRSASAPVFPTGTNYGFGSAYLDGVLVPKTQFQIGQGVQAGYDQVLAGLAVPSTLSIHQADAFSAYASDAGQSSSPTNVVAGYFSSMVQGANSRMWAINPVVSDGGFASASILGGEFDCNVLAPATTIGGCILVAGEVNGRSAVGFQAIHIATPAGGRWGEDLQIDDGSSPIAIRIGALGTTASKASMPIQFRSFNSAGTLLTGSVIQDDSGNIVFAPASGGTVQSGTQFVAPSFSVPAASNPGKSGSVNLGSPDVIAFRNDTNTGDVLIGHSGSNDQITFNSGINVEAGGATVTGGLSVTSGAITSGGTNVPNTSTTTPTSNGLVCWKTATSLGTCTAGTFPNCTTCN